MKETIDTQLLRVFVAVAKHGGVTFAAEALGITKSAVSKQLHSLEAHLQIRLFERVGRRMEPTVEGALLLSRAESILAELEHLLDDAKQRVTSVSGTVRIAASSEFAGVIAEHFLPLLVDTYPALRIAMPVGYHFDDLQEPAVDLAFRLGSLNDDRLVARPLGRFARVLVCSPSFAQAHPLDTPRQLETTNALTFSDYAHAETWPLVCNLDPTQHHDVNMHGSIGIRSFAALAGAAMAGMGVARLPAFVAAPHLSSGRLVRVLSDWRSPPVSVLLAYRAGISRVGRVRAVIDEAVANMPRILSTLDEGLVA